MDKNSKTILKSKSVKEFLRSRYFWRPFLGVLTGGVAGFIYYYLIGCATGSCPITSHSYSAIIVGGLLGYLITSSL